jgi:hypothetical protein
MMDPHEPSRAAYRPSGKIHWLKFFPGLVLAAATAVVMAWCLYLALQKGFYLIFAAPIIAALFVAGVWYLVLTWSHCRNRWIAAVASVALGLLLYLGYYQIGLLDLIGAERAHRIDLLPRYIEFRMKTDVARDVHFSKDKDANRQGPDRVQQAFNWFFFGGELLAVVGVIVGVGLLRSSKAYCESCGKWMKSETLKLAPGSGATIWESLQAGNYAEALKCLASTSRQSAIGCMATIEHCPACAAQERPQEVYLTVKDVPTPGKPDRVADKVGAMFKPKPSAGLRTLVNRVALRPGEVGTLAATFPGLKSSVEAHPKLFAQAQSAAREIGRAQTVQPGEWNKKFARIESVDPRSAGTVLTRTNAIIQTVIGVASIFGGFALAFAPALVLYNLEPKPPDWVFGTAAGWLIVCLLLNLFWILCFPTYFTTRFMRRQTRRAFEYRPDPAVDLRNPDLFFVDVVPRINWGKQMMENATDIGFLDLNKARRELIFEGDRQRYWVPVESILEVKREFWAESVQHQLQRSPTLHHLVVIRAMTADGPWETWFSRRQNKFQMRTAKRRLADAVELETKIRELMTPVR